MPASTGPNNIPVSAAISGFTASEWAPIDSTVINGVYRLKCTPVSSYVDPNLSATAYPPIKIDWSFTRDASVESVYNVSTAIQTNNVKYFDAHTNWTDVYSTTGYQTVPTAYFIPLGIYSVYNCKDFVNELRARASEEVPSTAVSSNFDMIYETIDMNPTLLVTFTHDMLQYIADSNATQGIVP